MKQYRYELVKQEGTPEEILARLNTVADRGFRMIKEVHDGDTRTSFWLMERVM